MLKLSRPITSINGFKIGDKVRLKDGDGRPHIIKSFSIDGMKEFFFEVQFEDGTEAMLDNIAPLPCNLDEAAEVAKQEYVYNDGGPFPHTTGISFFNGFKAGAEWQKTQMMEGAMEAEVADFNWELYNRCVECGLTDRDKVKIIILKDDDQR